MKRKILFILSCALLTVQAMAQSENKKEILTKEKKQTAINQELINNPIRPIGIDTKMMLPDYKEPKTSFDTTTNSLRLKLPPLYYGNNAIFPFYKKMFFIWRANKNVILILQTITLRIWHWGGGLTAS